MTCSIPLRFNKEHQPPNGHNLGVFGKSFLDDGNFLIHKWRYSAEVLGPLHLELWRFACDRHTKYGEQICEQH